MQALLELDCLPAGMELFPAADDTQWALIQRVIDDCDYYVVIIGGRYGSTDRDGVSFTEREYDYAVELGLPVLAFVHGDPSAIAVGKTELEMTARQKLVEFRGKAQKRMCKLWRTPEELGGVVSRSLIQTMKARPAEGWVRARHAASPEQLNALRGQIDSLTAELVEARTVAPAEAEGLAKGSEVFVIRYSYKRLGYDGAKEVTLSWDQIFATVGPAMFGEASDQQLKEQLQRKIVADENLKESYSFALNEEDFQTVKIQLLALGLMQESVKKRTVSDKQTYWTVTPYGKRYVTVIKAIRSSPSAESK